MLKSFNSLKQNIKQHVTLPEVRQLCAAEQFGCLSQVCTMKALDKNVRTSGKRWGSIKIRKTTSAMRNSRKLSVVSFQLAGGGSATLTINNKMNWSSSRCSAWKSAVICSTRWSRSSRMQSLHLIKDCRP